MLNAKSSSRYEEVIHDCVKKVYRNISVMLIPNEYIKRIKS